MRKLWPGLLAIAFATAFGLLNLGKLPAELPVHWNFQGEVDGWAGKNLAVIFMPLIALAIAGLVVLLPRIDPRRANFPLYAGSWWIIGNAILVFLAALHVVTIGYGLGWKISMPLVVGICVGALFVVLGNYLTRVRPNWFLGIRTPWTLSNERVWRETHRVGGTLMVVGGLLLIVITAITGKPSLWALLACGLGPPLFALGYSYVAWRRDSTGAAVQQ